MKNIFSFLLLSFLFVQCSPKTRIPADASTEKVEEALNETAATDDAPEQVDFRGQAPEPGPAPKIQMGTYDHYKMENGLQVIIVENHKLPRVSFQLFVDAPSIMEEAYAGYIDMAGDLLSKGTKSKSKSELDEEIDFIGATLSTSTSGIFASSLTKHSDKLLDLMSDILYNPAFPESEFEKAKKQTLSSLAQSKEDPNTIARNVANVMRFGKDHPYGELVTEETVEKITIEKIRSYYDTYFRPNISYLVVVGDVDPAKIKQKMARYFGKWEASKDLKRPTYKAPEMPAAATVDFVNKSGAVQSVISVTYPVDLKPGDPDAIPSTVMNTMLGSYFGSRLNANLRETNAYTYGAGSSLRSDRLMGYFSAGASVRNEVTDSSLVQFIYELKRVRDEKADALEVETVKSVISGRFSRGLENPQTVARFALNTFRYNLPEDYYANYLEKLSQVTPEMVQQMAQKYIHPDKAHFVVVGNKGEVADKLSRFASSGKVDYYDTYGNEVDMSSNLSTDGYTLESVYQKYFQAIGGKAKVEGINTVKHTFEMEMMGQKMSNEVIYKGSDKMSMVVSSGGTIMQKQVLNGEKAMASTMGKTTNFEGQQLEAFAFNGRLFVELNPPTNANTSLKDIQMIDNKPAFRVETKLPKGAVINQYYDVENGFKVRVETVTDGQTNTMDITDYQVTDGVAFPHKMTMKGTTLPVPLTMKSVKVEVNAAVTDDTFKVE
ncbi:MAG: pitrilysin family protein [Bacteroidota bacterium]